MTRFFCWTSNKIISSVSVWTKHWKSSITGLDDDQLIPPSIHILSFSMLVIFFFVFISLYQTVYIPKVLIVFTTDMKYKFDVYIWRSLISQSVLIFWYMWTLMTFFFPLFALCIYLLLCTLAKEQNVMHWNLMNVWNFTQRKEIFTKILLFYRLLAFIILYL